MDRDLSEGTWAVVITDNARFIGCIDGVFGENFLSANAEDPDAGPPTVADVLEADWIRLKPACDFFSPIRPVQTKDGGLSIGRDPIVMPLDFTSEDTAVYVKPNAVIFFHDMSERDRDTYTTFVAGAQKQQDAYRAARSGIAIPDGPTLARAPNGGRFA